MDHAKSCNTLKSCWILYRRNMQHIWKFLQLNKQSLQNNSNVFFFFPFFAKSWNNLYEVFYLLFSTKLLTIYNFRTKMHFTRLMFTFISTSFLEILFERISSFNLKFLYNVTRSLYPKEDPHAMVFRHACAHLKLLEWAYVKSL